MEVYSWNQEYPSEDLKGAILPQTVSPQPEVYQPSSVLMDLLGLAFYPILLLSFPVQNDTLNQRNLPCNYLVKADKPQINRIVTNLHFSMMALPSYLPHSAKAVLVISGSSLARWLVWSEVPHATHCYSSSPWTLSKRRETQTKSIKDKDKLRSAITDNVQFL